VSAHTSSGARGRETQDYRLGPTRCDKTDRATAPAGGWGCFFFRDLRWRTQRNQQPNSRRGRPYRRVTEAHRDPEAGALQARFQGPQCEYQQPRPVAAAAGRAAPSIVRILTSKGRCSGSTRRPGCSTGPSPATEGE
jgi:hypothetical protein